jgi:hypothetical protein
MSKALDLIKGNVSKLYPDDSSAVRGINFEKYDDRHTLRDRVLLARANRRGGACSN